MTEAEAKMKWCPHVRLSTINNLAAFNNRIGDSKSIETLSRIVKGDSTEIRTVAGLTMCIASECMAWRWSGWQIAPGVEFTSGMPVVRDRPTDDHTEHVGYCGLSGKP